MLSPAPMRIVLIAALLSLGAPVVTPQPLVIRVEMTEFAFRPAVIRLAANRQVRLVLANRGQLAHQFETDLLRATPAIVVGEALRVETRTLDLVRLQPGAAAMIEFYPRIPGRFAFACTIEGHKEAGMTGVLDVR